jgi:hypothetical protein
MGFLDILKKKGLRFIVIYALLAVIALFSAVTLASYVYQAVLKTYLVTALEDFYFTSDLLTAGEPLPVYQITHDWGTTPVVTPAEISFDLRNYADELNISRQKINFHVEADVEAVPAAAAAKLKPITPFAGSINTGGGNGKTAKPVTLQIELQDGVTEPPAEPLAVTVTATATAPYAAKLRGKFVISPALSCRMAENAGCPVAVFTITLAPGAALTREVAITWPAGAAPDMTNLLVIAAADAGDYALTGDDSGGGGTLTATLNTAAVYELLFFKDKNEIENEYTGVIVQETP